jgi:exopolyphosphatase / guanosine-5'-triphosphate,3'-diphosphate pyrophosphatase
MMRLASIDIGTHTILMLIADVEKNGTVSVKRDEHRIARLGKGVDEHGVIQKETFERVLDILLQLKALSDSDGVQRIAACGTSALRDAANRQEFIDFIREQLSINIKILSGKEEAESTYLGAVSEYIDESPTETFSVLDIGGGSTELVSGTGTNVSSAVSMDIGSVRLTERILKKSPPDASALENAKQFIQEHLYNLTPLPSSTTLIGVAGTLTTLAALDLQVKTFDSNLINRYVLTKDTIDRIFHELKNLTLDQIKNISQIHPARADILLAGILILREIVDKVNASQITVSDRGLRYGILLQLARSIKHI